MGTEPQQLTSHPQQKVYFSAVDVPEVFTDHFIISSSPKSAMLYSKTCIYSWLITA